MNPFIQEAISLSIQNVLENQGGPFGAVIVKDGKIIGRGFNKVVHTHDPTAHAEIVAIRDACSATKNFSLEGCTIYSSTEPCSMCYSAIRWAKIDEIFCANSRIDAAKIGFDDAMIYSEIEDKATKVKFLDDALEKALVAFKLWDECKDLPRY